MRSDIGILATFENYFTTLRQATHYLQDGVLLALYLRHAHLVRGWRDRHAGFRRCVLRDVLEERLA